MQEAFPGIDIIGKKDFKDADAFIQRIKGGTCAIVTSKNSGLLKTLVENFKRARVRGLTCLIIDDEADQASLNTREQKADGTRSAINDRITELRGFFDKNTYLQVTATPQALFLQTANHDFRPKFTVLSHPGSDYVGGDDFFEDNSELVKEFDIADISALSVGAQPSPTLDIPRSLLKALDTFMVAATYKRSMEADQNCAFLCHISTRKDDHKHIVDLLRKYKTDLASGVKANKAAVNTRLRTAYEDLARTHAGIRSTKLEDLIDAIGFFSPGITVKLVNGDTDEDVAVRSPYNLFVGGNKLGRGVTIKNLLVSYYGRNPKRPQADTVLQHARMYGYRRKDIGLLRLFLPRELHVVFKAINKMERSLRDLIAANPSEEFRGIYVESGLSPTRRNVLAPGAIGVYTAGSNYNPAQIVRDASAEGTTTKIDKKLESIANKQFMKVSISEIQALIRLTMADEAQTEHVWNPVAITKSIEQFANLQGDEHGYVYVDRDRDLKENRRETAGLLSGGELATIPTDKVLLIMFRTKHGRRANTAWWPQVRFPDGRYAFAFSI